MPINYATSYQQALANAFPKVLRFGALWENANKNRHRVVNAKTIEIPTVTTTGRVEGSRDTIASAKPRHTNDWESKTLTNHRTWDTLVHPVDINQTNMVLTIANITQAYNEQQKFLEMDCYTASKIYGDWAAAGGTANTQALTTDNVLAYIDKVMEGMDEEEVPDGRVLYVTPQINTMIKNAKEFQRYLGAMESQVARTVNRIDELKIETIPSNRMKTVYDFTVGAVPGTGAKQIDLFFVHPQAILPVQTYSEVLLSEPSAVTKGKWVYFEEAFEDVFILNKRKNAIAFHVTQPADQS